MCGSSSQEESHGKRESGRGLGERLRLYDTKNDDLSIHASMVGGASKNREFPKANGTKRGGNRSVDITQFRRRYVALELMYIGWKLHGFAAQLNTSSEPVQGQPDSDLATGTVAGLRTKHRQNIAELHRTVEGVLFSALQYTRLIDEDIDSLESIKYSRCGRTDKGVSAIGQVVALKLRSRQPLKDKIESDPEDSSRNCYFEQKYDNAMAETENDQTRVGERVCRRANERNEKQRDTAPTIGPESEIDYVGILNKALPAEIRVLGWSDVPDNFDARFSCSWRQYKYFFAFDNTGAPFRVDLVKEAAKMLEGEHDFRNFCKVCIFVWVYFQFWKVKWKLWL